jgi:hypothetical protein
VRILFGSPEYVVTENNPLLTFKMTRRTGSSLWRIGIRGSRGTRVKPFVTVLIVMFSAESCDLYDLVIEMEVRKPETSPYQAAVPEHSLHLARSSVGDHVEVLGFPAQEDVSYAPPNQIGLEALVLEAVEHLHRIGAQVLA